MNPIHRRLRARTSALLVALALVAVAVPVALAAPGTVIYDSQPNPLPGNIPSRAFQATQTTEFGDHIIFAAGPRELGKASVVFSSWACETGAWNRGNCVTTPGVDLHPPHHVEPLPGQRHGPDPARHAHHVGHPDRDGPVPSFGQSACARLSSRSGRMGACWRCASTVLPSRSSSTSAE